MYHRQNTNEKRLCSVSGREDDAASPEKAVHKRPSESSEVTSDKRYMVDCRVTEVPDDEKTAGYLVPILTLVTLCPVRPLPFSTGSAMSDHPGLPSRT